MIPPNTKFSEYGCLLAKIGLSRNITYYIVCPPRFGLCKSFVRIIVKFCAYIVVC